jgi:hypothetical protein
MGLYEPYYGYIHLGTAWPVTGAGDATSPPTKGMGLGYCLDCDEEVTFEYYQLWSGEQPPHRCLVCGGSRVYFLDEAGRHLLKRVKYLEQRIHKICLELSLIRFGEIWERLAKL